MEQVTSLAYKLINLITEISPKNGARLIDGFILSIVGNPFIGRTFFRRDVATLGETKRFQKICVIADVHIGDAIITQSAVSALRDFFPEAMIDYIFNKTAEGLIAGNPEVSNLWPVYVSSGLPYPSDSEAETIKNILEKSDYDFILDLCPFLPAKKIRPSGRIMNHLGLVMSVAQAQKNPGAKSHMVFQLYRHIRSVLEKGMIPRKRDDFRGVSIYLSDNAQKQADKILKDNNIDPETPKIFFNPDASTPFTRIPTDIQASLLKELLKLPCHILLGASRSESGFEDKILSSIRMSDRKRVTIVPTALPIDAYASLIDLCDIFITGDTGPLHIAAARKVPKRGDREFRNRTAVLSIFGATPPRIYGYDSRLLGFLPANQDAPSHVYILPSSNRNLTYIVKKYIAADERSFFENINQDEIVFDVKSALGLL
ncbi:MAG: glycosyltransferase family 9 protein [Minisyncoccia bacterium]|jgi:ADP-heptose:LPS heptosyltransferase